MKTTDKKVLIVRAVTGVFLLFACFYMYDFYKCLSGFIANGFREPLVMLPMVLAFLLPALCFLTFFYDFYVRAIHPLIKTVYSVLVSLYAIVVLVLIFNQIELYASNAALGVYDALPSIILHFPYDMIVVLASLLALQILNLAAGNGKGTRANAWLQSLKSHGTLPLRVWEYLLLCVLAIVVFVFTGAAVTATFTAYENAFYDLRYVFLLLWVMLVPMANLAIMTLRPERSSLPKRARVGILSAGIVANLIFGLLFLVLELTYPDFLVHIGKPVFLIAFSVSLPIEPGIILGIMVLGTLVMAIRLVLAMRNKYQATDTD